MPRQQGVMMGPMKGHLAPNSSPFKPTVNKLSSQYLIQDHMSSHYNKLGTTRAAIDNKPPKSMTTSVKKRDQMKREAMAKQMKLLDFENRMKQGSSHKQRPPSSMQRSFSVTVTKHGYDEVRPQSAMSQHSSVYSTRSRSVSGVHSPSSSTQDSPRGKTQNSDVLNRTYGGDYLDRHEERFKNVDTPFTPRLKKRVGKSFLSQSKHYAPPLILHKEIKRKTACKPASSSSEVTVPAHNTTTAERDDDHNLWKEDQSQIMQRLTLDNTRHTYDDSPTSKRTTGIFEPQRHLNHIASDTFFGTSSLGKSFGRSDTMSYETKYRIRAEEEEMKYLEFINAVTNDILTRGIYSDRVLKQVMDRHLEQNRDRLNEGRMRHMILKLQEDLGVSSEVAYSDFSTIPKTTYSTGRPSHSTPSMPTTEGRKKSPRKTPVRKPHSSFGVSSGTSGSEASDGGRKTNVQKGILKKTTGGSRSSGSEQDVRSSVYSSAEEDERKKLNGTPEMKIAVNHDTNIEKTINVLKDPETSETHVASELCNRENVPQVETENYSNIMSDSVGGNQSPELKPMVKMSADAESHSESDDEEMLKTSTHVGNDLANTSIKDITQTNGEVDVNDF